MKVSLFTVNFIAFQVFLSKSHVLSFTATHSLIDHTQGRSKLPSSFRTDLCAAMDDNDKYPQHEKDENDTKSTIEKSSSAISRRQLMSSAGALSFLSVLGAVAKPQSARAACLYGDLSTSCIGVYKLPLDDCVLSYVSTPEQLAKYAPDMNYVPPIPYPSSYDDAIRDIKSCDDDINTKLSSFIYNGKLEEAGLVVLSVIPKLTMAGRVVVNKLQREASLAAAESISQNLSMRGFRVETAMTILLSSLGGLDICIGQGMRGQMGALTAAQIQILPEVTEVIDNYKDLKRALPDDFRPSK